jgi:endonuclease-3
MSTLQEIQTTLQTTYGWRKFRFGLPLERLSAADTYETLPVNLRDNWVWRYLIASVIVSGSNEFRMQRICSELFRKYPTPIALAESDQQQLIRLFAKHRLEYGSVKAARIKVICQKVVDNDNRVWSTKEELIKLEGVGEHIAEVILATCYGQRYHFAVDIHVKEIAKRWGMTYRQLKKLPSVDGQFSRNLVDFGQQVCGRQPKCDQCVIAHLCKRLQKQTQQGLLFE